MGAALAIAFLGERLGWEELADFVLIAGGLGLVTAAGAGGAANPATRAAASPPARGG